MRSTSLLRQAATQAITTDAHVKSLAYATDLVRRTDHEAIYASYFYPSQVRPAYLALRALNAELAGLPDQVSNQLVGRMRFQWWKDAIKGLYDVSTQPFTSFRLRAGGSAGRSVHAWSAETTRG